MSITVQIALNNIAICFFTTIPTLKLFFFKAWAEKDICVIHRLEQRCLQRQISQSDCQISCTCSVLALSHHFSSVHRDLANGQCRVRAGRFAQRVRIGFVAANWISSRKYKCHGYLRSKFKSV